MWMAWHISSCTHQGVNALAEKPGMSGWQISLLTTNRWTQITQTATDPIDSWSFHFVKPVQNGKDPSLETRPWDYVVIAVSKGRQALDLYSKAILLWLTKAKPLMQTPMPVVVLESFYSFWFVRGKNKCEYVSVVLCSRDPCKGPILFIKYSTPSFVHRRNKKKGTNRLPQRGKEKKPNGRQQQKPKTRKPCSKPNKIRVTKDSIKPGRRMTAQRLKRMWRMGRGVAIRAKRVRMGMGGAWGGVKGVRSSLGGYMNSQISRIGGVLSYELIISVKSQRACTCVTFCSYL